MKGHRLDEHEALNAGAESAGRLERKRGSVGMADEMQLAIGLVGDGKQDAQIGVGPEGLARGPRI
jgi:hypothetical protein